MKQNDLNLFPLNFDLLKVYARRWVEKIPDSQIQKVTLYRYSSRYAEIMHMQVPVKYCIVFDVEDENLSKYKPSAFHVTGEDDRSIYAFLECFDTIRGEDSYLSLMDAGFSDIYESNPAENFKDEWLLLTRQLAEGDCGVMIEEPHWVLYDANGMVTPDARKPKRDIVTAEAKRIIQRQPNCSIKDAVKELNQYLIDMGWEGGYTEKHLHRLISPFGFAPGKPGRPPKKKNQKA